MGNNVFKMGELHAEMKINAGKTQCRKLWTCYGFGTNLLPFLIVLEQTRLQVCNKFFYNVAVS